MGVGALVEWFFQGDHNWILQTFCITHKGVWRVEVEGLNTANMKRRHWNIEDPNLDVAADVLLGEIREELNI